MSTKTLAGIGMIVVAGMATSCGDGDARRAREAGAPLCDEGTQRSCTGPGRCSGFSTCKDAYEGFGPCICLGAGGSGGTSGAGGAGGVGGSGGAGGVGGRLDAGLDAGMDAGDAGMLDAGMDASVPAPDAGGSSDAGSMLEDAGDAGDGGDAG